MKAVVFDVGRVIVQWQLRHLFAKLITDPAELDWFLAHVVTEQWHFQHDAGRLLADMVPERKSLFPRYADHIDAYATRFVETVPGRVEGTAELIERLAARDVPLFAITNFGSEFWQQFLPTEPVLQHMRDIVVSGDERVAKPDPRIFRIAQKRFGYAPQEMLFIDDNSANIEAAAALGWHVLHFTDAGARALEEVLAARGLI
ncbi:HAD-IA family hydrolase [Erythrobacter jejuensis]|uniref:HAD-IA family hydrolase n=1 Tax=Parerythrobacter jejuensis TaxID=795812 RepID=A0A845AM70_9SPHN|nr:HAD-IA family hydrolase [Parerythrobacter jejuensis]MXP33277.1 HAD-IA family hydrolase [Parerythrobacter jejuensis]